MWICKRSTPSKFGFLINLRSMASQETHGSGTCLLNRTGGVQLEIERDAKSTGPVNCHVCTISDSQFNIINKQLEYVQYWNGSWQHPIQRVNCWPDKLGQDAKFLVNQLLLNGKFDYIVLICPTFACKRTLYWFAVRDPRLYAIICEQHEVEFSEGW